MDISAEGEISRAGKKKSAVENLSVFSTALSLDIYFGKAVGFTISLG